MYRCVKGLEQYVEHKEGGSKRRNFHAIIYESLNRSDIDSFLSVIDAFLTQHQCEQIDGTQLAAFFRSMVKLFSIAPVRDLQAERQGLWGELFMMRQTRGFKFWSPFWHNDTTRLFDFSSDQRRVEVKTVLGQQRIHHFSHRQIYSIGREEILIVYLLLREEDAGLSLRELVEQCGEASLGISGFLKLERAVRRAGMEDPDIVGPVFDEAQAEISMCWFNASDVPHFRMPEPPGVSETRYKVDISTATPLSKESLNTWLDNWLTASALSPDFYRT